jgi:hypothetical protein
MTEKDGPIDTSITNNWFISSEHTNPGDQTINIISSFSTEPYNVYSYETPINFNIIYHICDADNNEINTYSKKHYYNEDFTLDNSPEEKENYKLFGWYNSI